MISRLVRAEIRERFSRADAREVRAALARPDLPPRPPGREGERVLLAFLKIADGDLAKFRDGLALAEADWRDVLWAAGLHQANWPAVLERSGLCRTACAVTGPVPGARVV